VSDKQKLRMEALRELALAHAQGMAQLVPDSRERAIALTKVEEASFFANAAIARHGLPQEHSVNVPVEDTIHNEVHVNNNQKEQ
jgi:hypothetical protein